MPYSGYSYCKMCGIEHNTIFCPRCESMNKSLEKAFGKDKSLVFDAWLQGVIDVKIKQAMKRFRSLHNEEF